MQAVRLMNQGALVIDLRGKESYDAGHIGDARNVPGGGARIAGRDAEEVARQDRDHVLRQRHQRRRRRAHADEARVHQGIQSARRLECLGQGQPALGEDFAGRQGEDPSEPARRDAVRAGLVSVLPARQGAVDQEGLVFSEINVEEDAKLREEMIARSNRRTVPQIFIGDKHVGGCDDLFDLDG